MVKSLIFQVEDDEDFSFLMNHIITDMNKNINLIISNNGIDAIDLLNKYRDNHEVPNLILLDINLTGMSGFDVLKIIREVPYFESVPVVMFSTSDNPKDIKTAYEFGATDFITKPLGYQDLVICLENLYTKFIMI